MDRLEQAARFGHHLVPAPVQAEARAGGDSQTNPVVQRRKVIRDGKIVDVPDNEPRQPFVPFSGRGFRLGGGAPAPAPAPAAAGPSLPTLPNELIQHIGGFLGHADRGRLSQTSSQMHGNMNAVNQGDPAAQQGVLAAHLAGQMDFNAFMHHPVNQAPPGAFTIGSDSDEEA